MKLITKILIACVCVLPLYIGCIHEPEPATVEVIKIENTIISYYNGAGDKWYCREALVPGPQYVMFPRSYENDIRPGTPISYHCHQITSYQKSGKTCWIDWEGNKEK